MTLFIPFRRPPRLMACRHHELRRIRTGDSIRQGPRTPLEAREREYVMKGVVTTADRSSSRHPSRPSAVHGAIQTGVGGGNGDGMVEGAIPEKLVGRSPRIGLGPSFDCSEKRVSKTGCICRRATITVCIGGAGLLEGVTAQRILFRARNPGCPIVLGSEAQAKAWSTRGKGGRRGGG